MRLLIVAVGRLRGGPETALIDIYATRIGAAGRNVGFSNFDIREVEAPKGLSGAKRQVREGALLLQASRPSDRRIVLDENGRSQTSEEFANHLAEWRDDGAAGVTFFVGGADGHDANVLSKSDLTLSFGKATWPHMLARVMLCEQIYRAMMILSGHPYHRS